jgi:hypothetical protein
MRVGLVMRSLAHSRRYEAEFQLQSTSTCAGISIPVRMCCKTHEQGGTDILLLFQDLGCIAS